MKEIYNFDDLGDCYSFNSTTVTYLIGLIHEYNEKLKESKSFTEISQIIQRITELEGLYQDHSIINIVSNDLLLEAITESVNAVDDISSDEPLYVFPFGVFGYLTVSNDYLTKINFDLEEFRKDLFDKVGFVYNPIDEMITDDSIDFDMMRRNGVVYSVNGLTYGRGFLCINAPKLYLQNMEMAPVTVTRENKKKQKNKTVTL